MNKMEIIKEAKSGYREAVNDLLMINYESIVELAKRFHILYNYDVEDLVNIGVETFYKCYSNYKFNNKVSFEDYLKANIISTYAFLIRREKEKADKTISYDALEGEEPLKCSIPSEYNVEEEMIENERNEALKKAMRFMSNNDKDLLNKRYVEDMSARDYAKEIDMSWTKISRLEKKAAFTLKQRFSREYGENYNIFTR